MTWNWIRTTDRLPDHSNPVLIWCRDYGDGSVPFIAFLENGIWHENTDGEPLGTDLSGDVTHWCEIEPPNEWEEL